MGESISKLYHAKGTLIIESPAGSFIAFKEYPLFVKIFQKNWVDISRRSDSQIVKEWFGNFVDYDDLDAGASVHIIKQSEWLKDPSVGRSFYGLVSCKDNATPSDILKDKRLVNHGSVGLTERKHLGYYLSHPIEKMHQIVDGKSLAEICSNKESLPEQKSRELFNLSVYRYL